MALTNTAVKGAKPRDKQWKLSDGGGLHLLIYPNGSKYWRLKFRFAGKEKVLALGIYPETSLAEARVLQSEAKSLLRNGTDPSLVRKQQKRAGRINAENTFEAIALDWFEQQKGLWSKDHADRVLISLEQDAFPYIGYRPIAELTPPDILDVIRKVESRDALDVAGRILQRCSAICRYAVQTGRAQMNPASELKGVLKTRKVKHRPAITRADLPEFLSKISSYDGHTITRFALKLLNLTFVRPGELRFSKWKEFEIEKKVWRVPGERFDAEGNRTPGMKMGTEHLVPLS